MVTSSVGVPTPRSSARIPRVRLSLPVCNSQKTEMASGISVDSACGTAVSADVASVSVAVGSGV